MACIFFGVEGVDIVDEGVEFFVGVGVGWEAGVPIGFAVVIECGEHFDEGLGFWDEDIGTNGVRGVG